MCALQRPALIFMNYKGLMQDQKTLTHEMGHAINFYLMGNNVDYFCCAGTEYEMEIPSTFNEVLFVDYALKNYAEIHFHIYLIAQPLETFRTLQGPLPRENNMI
jgi:oligoendopeptidase F